jgi:hypothetical protein
MESRLDPKRFIRIHRGCFFFPEISSAQYTKYSNIWSKFTMISVIKNNFLSALFFHLLAIKKWRNEYVRWHYFLISRRRKKASHCSAFSPYSIYLKRADVYTDRLLVKMYRTQNLFVWSKKTLYMYPYNTTKKFK